MLINKLEKDHYATSFAQDSIQYLHPQLQKGHSIEEVPLFPIHPFLEAIICRLDLKLEVKDGRIGSKCGTQTQQMRYLVYRRLLWLVDSKESPAIVDVEPDMEPKSGHSSGYL
jgi:hypothetical protein